jgi:hypothetical protein
MTTAATATSARQDPAGPFTTTQAAHIILGGLDTEAFWGFEFEDFVHQFQERLARDIGAPLRAPWRGAIDFTAQDYVDLRRAADGLDFTPNPAELLDEAMATEFIRRSDVLGLNGPIGCGKDTAAEALEPHGFVRASFAEPLRLAGSMVYGIPPRYFVDRELKETALPNSRMTPRRVLQLMGTEVCRSIHEPIWVKRMLLRVASAMHDLNDHSRHHPERISGAGGIRVVIPDVRFQNEADFVRHIGGRVVRISRPELDVERITATKGAGHSSESGVSQHPTDIYLVNAGTKEQFQRSVVQSLMDDGPAVERRLSSRISRPRP